jgi:phosphatidylserine decarboxylase
VLALLAFAVGWMLPVLAVVPALAALFTLWFFRDPERHVPREPGTLVSPADGRILCAGPSRISIFMNVFDVHVCRAPATGRVVEARHVPGSFRAAFHDHASEHNERVAFLLERDGRQVRFQLVAGLVARRVVCRVAAGDHVEQGQRIGLIRFGSRVDVDLEPGDEARVRPGQRVTAGETLIARLRMSPGEPPDGAGI